MVLAARTLWAAVKLWHLQLVRLLPTSVAHPAIAANIRSSPFVPKLPANIDNQAATTLELGKMAIDYGGRYVLPRAKPLSIRLIQIQPRKEDEGAMLADIVLRMRVVNLDPAELLPGESPRQSGRPTIRFEEETTGPLPQEYFGIPKSSMPQAPQPNPKSKKMLSMTRLVSKLKSTKLDDPMVPVTAIPEDEPMVRGRFKWGNYVAMSYSWGAKEEWEMTEEEKVKERKRLDDPATDPEERKESKAFSTDVKEVVIDNERIRVRYNLWSALLRFREMVPFKKGVWLWNDALCINQTDDTEKLHQLGLMSLIYRQAGNIIVHAGDAWFRDEDTSWVFDYLQKTGVDYRTEFYEAMDHAGPQVAQSHRWYARMKLEESAKQWAEQVREQLRPKTRQYDNDYAMISVYDFFDRPYWRRLWIIQELAMAHHTAPIVCGGYVTQWRYVRDAALLLCMVGDAVVDAMQRALMRDGREMKREPSFRHVAAIAELAASGNRKDLPQSTTQELLFPTSGVRWGQSNMSMTLTNITLPLLKVLEGSPIQQALALAAGAHCFYDRDRVYGLLAIPALSKLSVQNLSSKSTTDIYIKFAKACIETDDSLDIFAIIEGSSGSPDPDRDLPSWVPRFNIRSKIGRIEGDWSAGPPRRKNKSNVFMMDETALLEIRGRPKFEGEMLVCHGWVVDTIDGLGALSQSDIASMMPGRLFKSEVLKPRFQPAWSTVSDLEERIWATLVGGTATNGKKAPKSFGCLLESFPGA